MWLLVMLLVLAASAGLTLAGAEWLWSKFSEDASVQNTEL